MANQKPLWHHGFTDAVEQLNIRYPKLPYYLIAVAHQQTLFLASEYTLLKRYSISTARAGLGNLSGSYKTPLGYHRIAAKIGDNAPLGSIFKGRINTQKIATIKHQPDEQKPQDLITSRILWLDGEEIQYNKGKDAHGNCVDSYSRYIYIHGTDEEGRLGQSISQGCIRMANNDVIDLYNRVEIDTILNIIS